MPLMLYNGALLLVDGALAGGENCCCSNSGVCCCNAASGCYISSNIKNVSASTYHPCGSGDSFWQSFHTCPADTGWIPEGLPSPQPNQQIICCDPPITGYYTEARMTYGHSRNLLTPSAGYTTGLGYEMPFDTGELAAAFESNCYVYDVFEWISLQKEGMLCDCPLIRFVYVDTIKDCHRIIAVNAQCSGEEIAAENAFQSCPVAATSTDITSAVITGVVDYGWYGVSDNDSSCWWAITGSGGYPNAWDNVPAAEYLTPAALDLQWGCTSGECWETA